MNSADQSPHPPAHWTIRRFDEIPSTNDSILEAARRGEPEWTVHIARRQSRGRGRAGHSWWSPEDRGLWMSILLRPRVDGRRLGALALVTGIAVKGALESLGARPIDVFWPNDLYHRGRKLGGILCEARSHGPVLAVAVGIGVNLDLQGADTPQELQGAVASLSETGAARQEPEAVAVRILECLHPLYRALENGASIPALIQGGLAGIGGPVRVRLPGQETWTGMAVGIGKQGELLVLRDGGGTEALLSADVEYLPRPS